MKWGKEEKIALGVVIGYILIPNIDAVTVSARIKELSLEHEVRCHDNPKDCWIQIKSNRKETANDTSRNN